MRDFERKKLYALINLAIEKNDDIDNGQYPFGFLASLLKECELRIDEYELGAQSLDKSIVLYTFKSTDQDVLSNIESLDTRLISLCDELLEDKYELAHKDGEYIVKTKLERNVDKLEFAPKHTFEELEKHLITEIKKAKHSIFAAVAWFTNPNIMNALKERANEGVDVILLVDKGQIPGNTRSYDFIKKYGVLPFCVYPCLNLNTHMGSTYQNTMHHKFCIIDNEVVVYGTYNWTTKAEYNDEDLTIDDNKKSVNDFTNRFCELRKKYSKIYGMDYSKGFWE
ncbi:MAG: phospholipase D-like domain-containing protein [Acholeplasmataceae bacterium]|nr:phospholipase D-like domain-containing protein [Acholeplasmataceae bacterium]